MLDNNNNQEVSTSEVPNNALGLHSSASRIRNLKVPASGAVIGDEEKAAMHAVIDRGWLTANIENERFEQALSDYTGSSTSAPAIPARARTCWPWPRWSSSATGSLATRS
jgi:hypothetical protein